MKKIRQLLIILLAAVLVFGMSATAFAEAPTATITVNGAGTGAGYAFQQIIEPAPETPSGWRFTADYAQYFTNTNAFNTNDEQAIISQMTAFVEGTLGERERTTFPAAYAQALKNIFEAISTVSERSNTCTVQKAGVYFIKIEETGADAVTYSPLTAYVNFCSYHADTGVPEALQSVAVDAKKTMITVAKTDSIADKIVAVGDRITFTITTAVPTVEAENISKGYVIRDTITGAAYDRGGTAMARIGGEVVGTFDFSGLAEDEHRFTMDLSDLINAANTNAGKTVVITYDAIVTAVDSVTNTAEAMSKADAALTYGKTGTDTLYTGKLEITKLAEKKDPADADVPLSGAKFNIYLKGEDGERKLVTFAAQKDAAGAYVSNGDAGLNASPTDRQKTENVVESGADGSIKVTGLKMSTYILKEVEAPRGYHIGTGDETEVTLALTAGAGGSADQKGTEEEPVLVAKQNVVKSQLIYNSRLPSLPATGGIGVAIFTIGGCALMMISAGLYAAGRRRTAK